MVHARIRAATAADVESVERIARTTWNEAYDGILAQETIDEALEEWYGMETIRERVATDETTFIVAVRDETALGYANGGREVDDGVHLGSIYVRPDHWGAGIGSALIETFEAQCVSRGYRHVDVFVLADNERAREFYRSRGYELLEERDVDLFGTQVRDVHLRKVLD